MTLHNEQFSLFENNTVIDQIKLSKLSVFNWGSFNGLHSIDISPNGTLITGENGAGKSTIIDALMILLRPAGKADFNMAAAQGDRSDRSLVSYMRGSYGRSVDDDKQVCKNLRENSVATVIKAVYKHTTDPNKIVVLLAVFYINGVSNQLSDVRKIYCVSDVDIDIKDILKAFPNHDARNLKQYLKSIKGCTVCDDNFSEYQTHFRHKLHMENINAPALLSRALGLKKIDNLTDLIRNLVLEPGEIKVDAQRAIGQFEDLRLTHLKLEDARNREKILEELPAFSKDLDSCADQIGIYKEADNSILTYIAKYGASYYEKKIASTKEELERNVKNKEDSVQHKLEAESYEEQCHEIYIKNGGGAIEKINADIVLKKDELQRITRNLTDYNRQAQSLGLKDATSEEIFNENLERLSQIEEDLQQKDKTLATKKGMLMAEKKGFVDQLNKIKETLQDLSKRPNSNVDYKYQRLRDDIVSDLNLDPDDVVFAAELMDVKSSEESWHGAIERALGGFRLTLLVDREDYRDITKWINHRHTGLHVRVQAAERNARPFNQFGNRGYLVKLNFKDHPYTNWLKSFVQKFDLQCVNSAEELNSLEYAMTKEGSVQYKRGSFEKKDQSRVNDRHEWYLGFNNDARLKLLAEDQEKLKELIDERDSDYSEISSDSMKIQQRLVAIRVIQRVDSFEEIDTSSIQRVIDELNENLKNIQNSDDTTNFKKMWEQAKKQRQNIDASINLLSSTISTIEKDLVSFQEQFDIYDGNRVLPIKPEIVNFLDSIVEKLEIPAEQLFYPNEKDKLSSYIRELSNSCKDEKSTIVTKAVQVMTNFKTRWPTIAADWNSGIESLHFYIDHLEKVVREGLPALVEDFKEKLNTEVTQTIACIVQKMEYEISFIEDRIGKINDVLSKADFRQNSFLCIRPKKIPNEFIKEFENDVKIVLSLINSDEHDKRYQYIETVIEKLSVALSSNSNDNRRLLDPRLRMQFTAEEIDRDTLEIKDVLDSSSGKSGGEKESFAGSVVAASLAYVLTPEDEQAPVYSTVFLDEAFSNTSDSVSVRVLKIFKELNLHVNLITPFKNIDVARDYADSLIIMTRNMATHSSTISELTWKDYDSQLKHDEQELNDDVASLGIDVKYD